MRKNQVNKVTVAFFSLLLLIISFSQLDLLVLASNNSKTSLLLDQTSTDFSYLQYCFRYTGGHLSSTVVFPLVFCLNHPAFSVLFFGFATLLIINIDRKKKQKMALVRSELLCYNMVPGFDGDTAGQGGAEGNESKNAEVIPTEKTDQENDVAKSTPAAVEGNDGSKPPLKLSIAVREVKDREYHPAYRVADRLIWDFEKGKALFFEEHAVTVEPIRTDLLIVKQDPNTEFTDMIGSFFRTYNFIQFKGTTSTFEIGDVFKELTYVFAFKSQHSELRFSDCALTVFCSRYPRKALRNMKDHGFIVNKSNDPNIIYVDLYEDIKMQIVVVGNLVGRNNEYAPLNIFAKKT